MFTGVFSFLVSTENSDQKNFWCFKHFWLSNVSLVNRQLFPKLLLFSNQNSFSVKVLYLSNSFCILTGFCWDFFLTRFCVFALLLVIISSACLHLFFWGFFFFQLCLSLSFSFPLQIFWNFTCPSLSLWALSGHLFLSVFFLFLSLVHLSIFLSLSLSLFEPFLFLCLSLVHLSLFVQTLYACLSLYIFEPCLPVSICPSFVAPSICLSVSVWSNLVCLFLSLSLSELSVFLSKSYWSASFFTSCFLLHLPVVLLTSLFSLLHIFMSVSSLFKCQALSLTLLPSTNVFPFGFFGLPLFTLLSSTQSTHMHAFIYIYIYIYIYIRFSVSNLCFFLLSKDL